MNKYTAILYILGCINEIMWQSYKNPNNSIRDYMITFVSSLLWPIGVITRTIVKIMD